MPNRWQPSWVQHSNGKEYCLQSLDGREEVGDDFVTPYEIALVFDVPQGDGGTKTSHNLVQDFVPSKGPQPIRLGMDAAYVKSFWENNREAAILDSGFMGAAGTDKQDNKLTQRQYDIMTCYFVDHFIVTFCELQTNLYWSRDKDQLYLRIAATVGRLKQAAEDNKFSLMFDRELDQQCGLPAFAPYTKNPDKSHLWQRYPIGTENTSIIMRDSTRIKLIYIIIMKRTDLDLLMNRKIVDGILPLHNQHEVDLIKREWTKKIMFGLNPPVHDIRGYFGEEVAYYFAFSTHYKMCLCFAGAVGFLLQAQLRREKGVSASTDILVGPYCLFMTLWAVYFLNSWKQQAYMYSIKWATRGHAGRPQEKLQAQFHGHHFVSQEIGTIVDNKWVGKSDTVYSPIKRKLWQTFSKVVTGFMLLFVMFSATTVMGLKNVMERSAKYRDDAVLVNAIMLGIQIAFLNIVYTALAKWLTKMENYRTRAETVSKTNDKVVWFVCCNTFFSFFYIVLVKKYFEGCLYGCRQIILGLEILPNKCPALMRYLRTVNNSTGAGHLYWDPNIYADDHFHLGMNHAWDNSGKDESVTWGWDGECNLEAASNLQTIFLMKMSVDNVIELLIPLIERNIRIAYCDGEKRRMKQMAEKGLLSREWMAPAESQARLDVFDVHDEYVELTIDFGYCTLFVACYPAVCLIACVGMCIEQWTDMFKLLSHSRRSQPTVAQNTGPWLGYMTKLSHLATFTNAAIFALNTEQYFFDTAFSRMAGFVVFVLMSLYAQNWMHTVIPPVSDLATAIARRHHSIVQSLLHDVDVLETSEEGGTSAPAYTPNLEDAPDDYEPPNLGLNQVKFRLNPLASAPPPSARGPGDK